MIFAKRNPGSLCGSVLILILVTTIISCGGRPRPALSPTVVPPGVLAFEVSGAVGSLDCTGSTAEYRIVYTNEAAITIKVIGTQRDAVRYVGRISWLGYFEDYAKLGWESASANPTGLASINLTLEGEGLSDSNLTCIPGATQSPNASPLATDSATENEIVCATLRNTISNSLAEAVSLYTARIISLYDLGGIYLAWASGAQDISKYASGRVKDSVNQLIEIAEQTGSAAISGAESETSDGIVAFSNALGAVDAACR